MKVNAKGFSLVEIMIVVTLIAILSAIAIPNFTRARSDAIKNSCLANIKQLQSALEMAAALDNADYASLDEAGIEALVVSDYLNSMPDCTLGDYSTDASGTVACSVAAHAF